MPVYCEIQFPEIDDEEMRAVDYRVMGHVFATHNELGCLDNIPAQIEVPVHLLFRTFSVPLKLDMVVEQKVVYELKTVSTLNGRHTAQLLDYLYLTNSTHGKLINFRPRSVQSRFVNTTLDISDRRQFPINADGFSGPEALRSLVHDLVGDWGTGLDASLYRRAILHCSDLNPAFEQMLPMTAGNSSVGCQRFHLLEPDTALGVTTYKGYELENYRDFEKLIAFSPLKRLHWVNIAHHQVLLTTVHRHFRQKH